MPTVRIDSIEDLPLVKDTLRIMKFFSYLLVHNWRRYASLSSYILVNISQFLGIYFSAESLDVIIRSAYIAVLFFSASLRALLLSLNRADYEAFIENLRVLYLEIMRSDDIMLRQMLRETTKSAHILTKINTSIGIFSIIGFLCYPIFATTRVLPFDTYVPYIDSSSSPIYEILFAIQVMLAPVGCFMYIPYTNLVVTFMIFAIFMCKLLQYKMRQLVNLPAESVSSEIVWCIEYHQKVESYVHAMNCLTTYVFLVEFLTFGAMLCGMLFSLVIVETVAQKITVFFYIFMVFIQSVIMYSYANEVYEQSLQVAVAAYDTNWYDFDVETQQMIKLFILRAQRPLAILLGKVHPMNLAMLQSLLKATFSYFTLLRELYN